MASHKTSELLQARYQSDTIPSTDLLTPVLEAIYRHKSIRRFLPTPLPDGTLESLVSAGQSASTSSMLQAWAVVAVQDKDRKDAAAKLCGDQDFIRQAPLMLFFCADLSRLTYLAEEAGEPDKGLEKMDMFIMAAVDAALASQNVALGAESLGLGVCYVGAARNNSRQLCELLNLPRRAIALFGLAVGVPDPTEKPSMKPRLPMREVLHREVWDDQYRQEDIQVFDDILINFDEFRQVFGREPWSRFVPRMLADGNLDGREIIRNVLEERGFKLE